MKITIDNTAIIEYFPYLEVGGKTDPRTGKNEIINKRLPIHYGEVEMVDTEIDCLIITSDLQGIVEENGEHYLLGERLPSFLKTLLEIEFPETKKTGVLLCGDLYTSLEKRGMSGDVRGVWKAFNNLFDWVVGVAGNHDSFGTREEQSEFASNKNMHLLHMSSITLNGLKIGGIGGIIGRSDKPNRTEEKDYLKSLSKLLKRDLDLILIHETPDSPQNQFIGNSKIRETIESNPKSTICCGHCHWDKTFVEFQNQSQVINVDSKVLLLSVKSR